MIRLAIIPLFVFLVCSCNKTRKNNLSIESINYLHQQIDSISKDSAIIRLKNVEQYIKVNQNIPDSVVAENYYLIGLHFQKQSRLDSAAIYFHNAIEYVNDSINSRQSYYFMSAFSTFSDLGLFGDCLTISEKFKSLIDSEKDHRALTWAYFWEQTVYSMKGDYQKAIEVNDLRLEVATKHDTEGLPAVLITRAQFKYFYLNDKAGAYTILEDLLKKEESLEYNNQSVINTDYGVMLYYDGNYKKALRHYLKALESEKKFNIKYERVDEIANCYNNIAEVYMDLKNYPLSKKYLDSVKMLGVGNLSREKQKSLLNYELRFTLETNKNSSELTKIMDEIYAHQDDIYKQKSENELLALTKSLEKQKELFLEKQAADFENLKLQTRSIIIITSLILLSLIGILLYSRRKLKFEKESLQLHQRLFRSQMNPHFTYNTLYGIQKEIKTDPKSAESYLLKFSRLLRLVLENSMNNYALLSKELEAIQKYLDLQLIHNKNKFSYEVILEDLDEDEMVFIPPMLLQPFIENSIEHGFSGINYSGQLTLKLTLKEKFIRCTIEDNGTGLKKGVNSKKQSASTQLIQDFLKKSTKEGFSILNKQDQNSKETGIIVQFLIPYKFTEND